MHLNRCAQTRTDTNKQTVSQRPARRNFTTRFELSVRCDHKAIPLGTCRLKKRKVKKKKNRKDTPKTPTSSTFPIKVFGKDEVGEFNISRSFSFFLFFFLLSSLVIGKRKICQRVRLVKQTAGAIEESWEEIGTLRRPAAHTSRRRCNTLVGLTLSRSAAEHTSESWQPWQNFFTEGRGVVWRLGAYDTGECST